jgi:hypothetical protein
MRGRVVMMKRDPQRVFAVEPGNPAIAVRFVDGPNIYGVASH